MDEEITVFKEAILDKVALMEQFANGVLVVFNQQADGYKDMEDVVSTLSGKIQEFAQENNEIQQLLEQILQEGVSRSADGGYESTGGGVSVDEEQVNSLIEAFVYEKIDFARIMKGHTARIFQEVEKRFIAKFAPELEKKKKNTPKIIAASVGVTILIFLALWGVFVNVAEKPYYELAIPTGGKVMWKEQNETEPRVITLRGDLLVPLAYYKQGKFLFYTYSSSGEIVKNPAGKPVTYYIYENAVKDNKVKAIKLGIPEE